MGPSDRMPLRHGGAGARRRTEQDVPPTLRQEIISNPRACIARNKLWRGDILPLLPIERNYFIIRAAPYDIGALTQDLRRAEEATEWASKDMHTHKWDSIALHSHDGLAQSHPASIAGGDSHRYRPTRVLESCPYIRDVLQGLGTDIYLVRLLRLKAGGKIKFHTDESVFKQRYDIIRCHIPIVTHPGCRFQLGCPVQRPASGSDGVWNANVAHDRFLTPGYLWFTNVNALHAVENNSPVDRVHLVIDMKPTKEMLRRIYGA